MNDNFIKAYNCLIGIEGGYVNNKDDKGGETYKGISIKYHPEWKGWKIINSLRQYNDFNTLVKNSKKLEKEVQNFYYTNYWSKFNGDKLPYLIAEELLEQSVVLGTWETAGKNLQTALNLLNLDGKVFPNLTVDGMVGPKTLQAVNKVNMRRLLTVLNGLEFCRFKESMDKIPIDRVFRGWFDRVDFTLKQ